MLNQVHQANNTLNSKRVHQVNNTANLKLLQWPTCKRAQRHQRAIRGERRLQYLRDPATHLNEPALSLSPSRSPCL